jgi:hypothetical protein
MPDGMRDVGWTTRRSFIESSCLLKNGLNRCEF